MTLAGLYLGAPPRYQLLHPLMRGGMSEIYLAEDLHNSSQVAIKLIHLDMTLSPEKIRSAYRAFRREVEVVARLSHPSIVPLKDFGQQALDNGSLAFIVMPYYPAGSLATWLSQGHQKTVILPRKVTHFVSQAANALQYAHDKGVIHRDVKPSNFLVKSRDNALSVPMHRGSSTLALPDLLLADFGIAKLAHVSTTTNSVIGSSAYMAPERWVNQPVYASDQYALAVMAYELMTGELPFDGEEIEDQHFSVDPLPLSQINPTLSSDIDQVILRALAKQYQKRFPSIRSFAQTLEQAVERSEQSSPESRTVPLSRPGRSVPPRSVPPLSPPRHAAPRRRSALSPRIALFTFLLLIAVVGVIIAFPQLADRFSGQASLKPLLISEPTNALQTLHPGPLVLTDTLKDNTQGQRWEEGTDSFGGCQFQTQIYHAFQRRAGYFTTCTAKGTDFSNFVYQAQITIVAGGTGGIIFRDQDGPGQCYVFEVSRDGSYKLLLLVDNTRANAQVLTQGRSGTIHTQLDNPNLLKVATLKNSFALFVNGLNLGTIQDQTNQYSNGHIGIFTDTNDGVPAEVLGGQINVWTL